MAVWQYNVFFIPFINFDENYLEFIKQPDTEFLKNTECFWNNSFINKNEIELRIDNFISYYKIVENDTQARKQAGNAVPVNLVKAVILQLLPYVAVTLDMTNVLKEYELDGYSQ